MRINILEQGMCALGGHFTDYALKLTRYYKHVLRHEVTIYCHAKVEKATLDLLPSDVTCVPLFKNTPWEHELQYTSIGERRVDDIRRTTQLVSELRKVYPADVWIWPTLYPRQLKASALIGNVKQHSGCIHWLPAWSEAFYSESAWADALTTAAAGIDLVGLRTAISKLTPIYESMVAPIKAAGRRLANKPGILVEEAPLFFDNTDGLRKKLVDKPKRVGFFGYQRGEKGSQMFEQLISRLLQLDCEVIFQDSRGKIVIPHHPRLRQLGYVESIQSTIVTCDLVILPYYSKHYQYRVSGVAVEALSFGVPLVVPSKTWMSRLAATFGAGIEFDELNADSVMTAVVQAIDNYPRLAHGAQLAADELVRNHGLGAFAGSLLPDSFVPKSGES